MRIIVNLLILILFVSCSGEQFTLEQYQKYPVKFVKKKFVYPDNSFELFLPYNWDCKIENYEDVEEIILGIDVASKPDEKNFINIMSIQKTKGFSTEKIAEAEYIKMLENLKLKSTFKLIESGKTKLLENETYYVHSKSTSGTYGELELITLITKSNSDKNFYYLTASASRTKELEKNMAIMIQCLRTFKQNEKK